MSLVGVITQLPEDVDKFISGALFKVSVPALKALLVAWQSWLGWPIITNLVDAALNALAQQAYKSGGMDVVFGTVDSQNAQKKADLAQAEAETRAAHAKGDLDAFKAAIAKLDAAAAAVTRQH